MMPLVALCWILRFKKEIANMAGLFAISVAPAAAAGAQRFAGATDIVIPMTYELNLL